MNKKKKALVIASLFATAALGFAYQVDNKIKNLSKSDICNTYIKKIDPNKIVYLDPNDYKKRIDVLPTGFYQLEEKTTLGTIFYNLDFLPNNQLNHRFVLASWFNDYTIPLDGGYKIDGSVLTISSNTCKDMKQQYIIEYSNGKILGLAGADGSKLHLTKI
jgi:hypothetical protein